MADRAAHDPFAPHRSGGARRPRRSTSNETLPDWLFDALRERDVPDEAIEPLRQQFTSLSHAERAAALADLQQHRHDRGGIDGLARSLVEFHQTAQGVAGDDDSVGGGEGASGGDTTASDDQGRLSEDEAAAAAIEKWHGYMVEAGDDPTEPLAALAEMDAWLDAQDDPAAAWEEMSALVGGDGPHKVAAFDAAVAMGWSFDDAMELTWPSEQYTPDRVTEIRESIAARDADTPDAPLPTNDDGSVDTDVPRNANDVVSWIDEGSEGAQQRAERALAVELTYPSPRKTVRAVLESVLGVDTVQSAIDGRG